MKEYRFAILIQMIFIGFLIYFKLFTVLEGFVVVVVCLLMHIMDILVNILNSIKDKK